MIGLAILFGLLSMLGYGLANTGAQPLARKLGSAESIFLRGFTIVIVLGVASLFHLNQLHHHWGAMLISFLLGVIGYLPLLAFTHGIRTSRLGIVAPIAGCSPLVTVVLTATLLHSSLNTNQWLGVIIIIIANIAVAFNLRNWRESSALQLSSGVPFALIAALGWGTFYYLLVYPTRQIGPWWSALLVEMGVTFAAALQMKKDKSTYGIRRALWPAVILNGLLIILGTVGYTIGVSYYKVSIVAALSNSTAVISTALAVLLLKEKLRQIEWYAAAAMILGVIAISIN